MKRVSSGRRTRRGKPYNKKVRENLERLKREGVDLSEIEEGIRLLNRLPELIEEVVFVDKPVR